MYYGSKNKKLSELNYKTESKGSIILKKNKLVAFINKNLINHLKTNLQKVSLERINEDNSTYLI